MSRVFDAVKPGVISGDDVQKVFQIAKENNFALPAVNVVNSDSINSVLEAAAKVKAPVVVQFSNGGAAFFAGKGFFVFKAANSLMICSNLGRIFPSPSASIQIFHPQLLRCFFFHRNF